MVDTSDEIAILQESPVKQRRNWWKVGFFVLLVLFEFAREWAVLASGESAQPNSMARVYSYAGDAVAQGRWKRMDGGSPMTPGTVTIDCRRELGRCVEASTNINQKYVSAPQLDWFEAKFTPEAITYQNDVPDCARYSVRIDLDLKKTFAVRERKENPSNSSCAMLEPRIEMQLADGYESGHNPNEGHLVPLFSALRMIID